MIKNNVKNNYIKLYKNLSLEQIEIEMLKCEKYMKEESRIAFTSSNYSRYVRGWLMKANFDKRLKQTDSDESKG